jgi:hypothetical protein
MTLLWRTSLAGESPSMDEFDVLEKIPLSTISSHDDHCCKDAFGLIWIKLIRAGSLEQALAFLPVLIPWGPTIWPSFWCQFSGNRPSGDCGVHAQLASLLFDYFHVLHKRGRAAVRPNELVAAHWRATWSAAAAQQEWLGEQLVHHEVILVGEKWWDPTEACWFDGVGATLHSGRIVGTQIFGEAWAK